MNISNYVRAVFPSLQPRQATLATELYRNLVTNEDQPRYVMEGCKAICLSIVTIVLTWSSQAILVRPICYLLQF